MPRPSRRPARSATSRAPPTSEPRTGPTPLFETTTRSQTVERPRHALLAEHDGGAALTARAAGRAATRSRRPRGRAAAVGSSSGGDDGSSASVDARLTRWSSPPDSSATLRIQQVPGVDRSQCRGRPPFDVLGGRAGVFDPERDLGRDARAHDLILGILEERGDRAGQLGRPGERVSSPPTSRLGPRNVPP